MQLASEIKLDKTATMIYGLSGKGKTHFLCTCPNVVILDTDRKEPITVARYSREQDVVIPIHSVDSYNEVKAFISILEKSQKEGIEVPIKNSGAAVFMREKKLHLKLGKHTQLIEVLGIDGSTDLYDMIMTQVQTSDGNLTQAPHPGQYLRAYSLFRSLIAQVKSLKLHFVCTALESIIHDETANETMGGPMFPKWLFHYSPKMFNAVGRAVTVREKGQIKYKIRIREDHRYVAKCEFFHHEFNEIEPNFGALMGIS